MATPHACMGGYVEEGCGDKCAHELAKRPCVSGRGRRGLVKARRQSYHTARRGGSGILVRGREDLVAPPDERCTKLGNGDIDGGPRDECGLTYPLDEVTCNESCI